MNRFAAQELAPVIDLVALKARCLGNLDLVDRVLAKFTGQVDADLDELDRAIHERNPAKAANLRTASKALPAASKRANFTSTLRAPSKGRWKTAWRNFPATWNACAAIDRHCMKLWKTCDFE